MSVNTVSTLTATQQFLLDKTTLARAIPKLQHAKFGQQRNLKRANGTKIKFTRFNALPPNTTPLMESVTPVGNTVTRTFVEATVQEYGAYVEIGSLLANTDPFPVLTEETKVVGEQAGQSIDAITRDILVAGTNVQYANGVSTRGAVAACLSEADLRKAIRNLARQNANDITEQLNASTGIGTVPVKAAFVAIIHPDFTAALSNATNFPGFIPVEKYGRQMTIMDGEVGAWNRIRFVESTQAKVFADVGAAVGATGQISTSGTLIDVYVTLLLGADAYGTTELDGKGMENIVKGLGSGGTSDPLNQRATTGWKSTYTAEILNDAWMLRLEHGCPVAP